LSYQKIDKKIHFKIKTPASFRAKEIRFQPNLQEGESLFSKAKEVEISPDGKSCKILQKEWKGEFLIC
ncbi:MAG: hypothetical protein NZL93_01745, partial [Chthoniobacterales bacterium]|nr:hypothetical protein [Chthoniobacterales bacterium]